MMFTKLKLFFLSGLVAVSAAYAGTVMAQNRCEDLLTNQEKLNCYQRELSAIKEEIKNLNVGLEEANKNPGDVICTQEIPSGRACEILDEMEDLENGVCLYQRKLVCKNSEEDRLIDIISKLGGGDYSSPKFPELDTEIENNPYRSRLCRSVRDSRLKLRCLRKLYRSTEIEAQNLGDWIKETDGRDGTFNCPAVVRFNSCTDVDSVYPERLNDICLGYDKLPCYSLKKVEIRRQIVAARGRFVRQSRR